ncbi:HprK-related kinase B [Thiomicrorhabdus cannonii]|uniref:HprK-related kinase B n=1 Tax=Thiomicrorhabdus cannonii TaxID=2748011 RepID=UPI0015C0C169|nr:HprK-related kinase B [Thiomicrorhabdus cannonii]
MSLLKQMLLLEKSMALLPSAIELNLSAYPLRIYTNSPALINFLKDYFRGWITKVNRDEPWPKEQSIKIYHSDSLNDLIDEAAWTDWQRDGGKTGRKEAILDSVLPQQAVRLLYKYRTGLVFLQPAPQARPENAQYSPLAFGEIEANFNQVINFILTQYANRNLRHDWQLMHASAVQVQNKGIAFAGFSGGGKSTLMLQLLEHGQHFISNDRVFIKPNPEGRLLMRGLPKQPRVNPGTLVNNRHLINLIGEEARRHYLALPQETLRILEQKYDVPVNALFGADCYAPESPLHALFVLNWQHGNTQPIRINPVELSERPDLLQAIMKSPGPLYAEPGIGFLPNGYQPQPEPYLKALHRCKVFEIVGRVDFGAAEHAILKLIPGL